MCSLHPKNLYLDPNYVSSDQGTPFRPYWSFTVLQKKFIDLLTFYFVILKGSLMDR